MKAIWLQATDAHLNTEKDSADSWDVLRHREGWETGVGRTPPGLPHHARKRTVQCQGRVGSDLYRAVFPKNLSDSLV